ncbi:MAG: creatininase family protein [Proteobacteria bacterium]|nr:creatininase family protein [Pseudomonadota bacterium]
MRAISWMVCGAVLLLSAAQAEPNPPDSRSIGGGECAKNAYNCVGAPNPLPPNPTVWIERMTWMDVRDAIALGKTTAIIPSGGIEPNGPWAALGKHDYVAQTMCEAVARKLGNALCAPVVSFVPHGTFDSGAAHNEAMGTIGVHDETYSALVGDIARSLQMQGFKNIILVGDHGGGQKVLAELAQKLNQEWGGRSVYYIKEFYDSWNGADSLLQHEMKVWKAGADDGLHDDPNVELQMALVDPQLVRWQERVKAGEATINGVSVADLNAVRGWGRKIVDYRVGVTVAAINKALSAGAEKAR